MSRKPGIEIVDENGKPVDLEGRVVLSTIVDSRGGVISMELSSPRPMSPEVDETWTRADVRRLSNLLVKRAKILDKIKGVMTLEAIADLECAIALDALREDR